MTDTPPSASSFARELSAFLEPRVERDAFSGAVLVAHHGRVQFRQAYGLAERNFQVANRPETRFNLGSMNKMFTAVAIAQLVQRGQLDLQDTLDRWLSSDWLAADVLARIRVIHLLNHSSGLGNYFNERFLRASRSEFRKLADYRRLIVDDSPRFEPGSATRYSNTGYMLLGAVIEQVSGVDYFEFVRERIYAPAAMSDSDCYELDAVTPNLAVGYTRNGPRWENNLFKHVIRGGPAGGGFSTVDDLLRFDRALRTGTLLPLELAERLWTPLNAQDAYGLGFALRREPLGRVVGHAGNFPGISTQLDMYLDSGHTVVVLANMDNVASDVRDRIQRLLAQT